MSQKIRMCINAAKITWYKRNEPNRTKVGTLVAANELHK